MPERGRVRELELELEREPKRERVLEPERERVRERVGPGKMTNSWRGPKRPCSSEETGMRAWWAGTRGGRTPLHQALDGGEE